MLLFNYYDDLALLFIVVLLVNDCLIMANFIGLIDQLVFQLEFWIFNQKHLFSWKEQASVCVGQMMLVIGGEFERLNLGCYFLNCWLETIGCFCFNK